MRISDWSSDVCSSDLTATALVDDRLHVAIFDRAVGDRLQVRLLVDLRRAADVEGPHRELRARLADRLGGDHADRLADVHRRAASKVAAIPFAADSKRPTRQSAVSRKRVSDRADRVCRRTSQTKINTEALSHRQ